MKCIKGKKKCDDKDNLDNSFYDSNWEVSRDDKMLLQNDIKEYCELGVKTVILVQNRRMN